VYRDETRGRKGVARRTGRKKKNELKKKREKRQRVLAA
jgi:hypothetical protein